MRDTGRRRDLALRQTEPGGTPDRLLIGEVGFALATRGPLNRSKDVRARLLARVCVADPLGVRDRGQDNPKAIARPVASARA